MDSGLKGRCTVVDDDRVFTQPRSDSEVAARCCRVRFTPMTGRRLLRIYLPGSANRGSEAALGFNVGVDPPQCRDDTPIAWPIG